MMDVPELFFISMIEQGLSYSSDSLTEEERRLLLTPVLNLDQTPAFTPQMAQRLDAKCVAALAQAYARDVAGKNRDAALLWRENNERVYRTSQLVLSGIVQNWYLSVGRSQEKKATGCLFFPVLLAVSIVLIAGAVWFVTHLLN